MHRVIDLGSLYLFTLVFISSIDLKPHCESHIPCASNNYADCNYKRSRDESSLEKKNPNLSHSSEELPDWRCFHVCSHTYPPCPIAGWGEYLTNICRFWIPSWLSPRPVNIKSLLFVLLFIPSQGREHMDLCISQGYLHVCEWTELEWNSDSVLEFHNPSR